MIDAISLLGDAGSSLSGIITHSAVLYDLAKKNLLDPKISAPGADAAPEFQSYLGRRIIEEYCALTTHRCRLSPALSARRDRAG
jgi:hypothetical protein